MGRAVKLPSDHRMRKTILASSFGLGGLGIFSASAAHADLVIISGSWGAMFVALAFFAGKPMEEATALKIAAGIIMAVSGIYCGVKCANTYFFYTGFGTPFAAAANASANALLTYLAGCAAAKVFLAMEPDEPVEAIIAAILALLIGGPPSKPT